MNDQLAENVNLKDLKIMMSMQQPALRQTIALDSIKQ